MRRSFRRPAPAMSVAVVALVVAATGGAAVAIGQDGAIQGCVTRSGDLTLITDGNPACDALEVPIAWNQQGPKGDPGPAGADGSILPPAALQIVDSVAQPPGKGTLPKIPKPKLTSKQLVQLAPEGKQEAFSVWRDGPFEVSPYKSPQLNEVVATLVVPAGRWVVFAKGWVVSGFINCDLQAGVDFDRTLADTGNSFVANVVHRFSEPRRVILRCGGMPLPNPSKIAMVKLTAVEVDKITNKPTSF